MVKRLLLSLTSVLFIFFNSNSQTIPTTPVFHVKFSSRSPLNTPTADKPQSKLWYMDSSWWALLPDSLGPTLWQRTKRGWKEHSEINNRLKGIPGRADVWYEDRKVTAVGVSDSSLYVYRLHPGEKWEVDFIYPLKVHSPNPKIETATIVKDAAGVWWVAADMGQKSMYTWSSKDGRHWSDPILIGEGMTPDDICSIAALEKSVLVIWSDQKAQAVYCRQHINGDPENQWSDIQTIQSGNHTADDHINTALSANGTLWGVTKNEVDSVGFPNLVLRVRNPDGDWKNFPYAILTRETGPSRPVIMTTPNPNLILSGYTVYDHTNKKRFADRIAFGIIDTSSARVLVNRLDVIAPDTSLHVMVNNITGPKAAFPPDGPWIILASDRKGNIYEANLRSIFGRTDGAKDDDH